MTDDAQAPWGGFKYSGIGREYGRYGIEAFLEPKAILGAIDGHAQEKVQLYRNGEEIHE
jgi:acyl-CoA reductase-like NAD-dependent aldehyde dehydrogenase